MSPRRHAVVALDQGIFAAITLSVTVIGARSFSVHDFGVFAAVLAVHGVSLGFSRAMSSELLVIRSGRITSGAARLLATRACWSRQVAAGTCLSIGAATVSAIAVDPRYFALIAFLPATYAHDFARYRFLADGVEFKALILDSAYLGSIMLMAPAATSISVDPLPLFGAIGVASSVSCGVGALLGAWSGLGRVTFARSGDKEALRYGVDYALGTAALQINLWSAVLLMGPSAAAALRGADLLLGPLRVLLQAVTLTATPRLASRARAGLLPPSTVLAIASPVLLLTAAWSTVANIDHLGIGRFLLNDTWTVVQTVDQYLFIGFCFAAITHILGVSLKTVDAGLDLIRARSFIVVLGSVASVWGVVSYGLEGAAISVMITSATAMVAWSYAVRRNVRGM